MAALLLGLALGAAARDAPAAAGDTTADRVLGQPDFTTSTPGFGGASGLRRPNAVAVDPTSGRLYVADTQNHRVLSWPSATAFTNGQAADRVIGQTDFSGFSPNQGLPLGNPTAATLWAPAGLAVDSGGNLYVADYANNRALRYHAPTSTGMSASSVFGQPDSVSHQPGLSASSLNGPVAVAVDAAGNLYVVDQNNQRVLEYDSGASTAANRVFGEPDMASALCNNGGRSASSLCFPYAVAVDSTGNLYVADGGNNRVLQYNNPLGTDTIADRVYGQVDFTGQVPSQFATASNLRVPKGVAIDAGRNLYVADNGFNRVLVYKDTLAGDTVADVVLGQGGDFTTALPNKGGLSADSLLNVFGVAVDAAGNLYVADGDNNRVLGFDQPLVGPPTGKSFTGPSATGTGDITASFTGGGAICAFSNPQFIGAPPGSPPVPPTLPAPGVDFPQGMFAFSAVSCTPGSTLSFTIVYPQALPPSTVYYKYGPTTANPLPHWYTLPATVVGNTITFAITDGGLGDDDLTANGTIVDQGGPGAPHGSAPAAAIPTLSEWMLVLLASIVGVIAITALRRRSGDRR